MRMSYIVFLFILLLSSVSYAQQEIHVPPGVHPKIVTDDALIVRDAAQQQIDQQRNLINQSMSAAIPPTTLLALPWNVCASSAAQVRLCGQVFDLNKLEARQAFGTDPGTAVFKMPFPYVPDHFFVNCAGNYAFPNLSISAPDVSCRFQPCKDLTANICGRDFAIPGEVEMGKTVPLSWLEHPVDAHDVANIFDAQCSVDGMQQVYTVDMKGKFCSSLPCPAGKIRICDTDIPIPEGTPAGSVLDMTLPLPFLPQPYVVQCLGSAGLAPTYQLVDHAAVTCAQKPQ